MITRCPDCHFMMIAEVGCTYCDPTKEVKGISEDIEENQVRNEEGSIGGQGDLFPEIQESSQQERT